MPIVRLAQPLILKNISRGDYAEELNLNPLKTKTLTVAICRE